jgi:hypothetical protein
MTIPQAEHRNFSRAHADGRELTTDAIGLRKTQDGPTRAGLYGESGNPQTSELDIGIRRPQRQIHCQVRAGG